jgi:polysaccharide biosynthesis PFTS motif protein
MGLMPKKFKHNLDALVRQKLIQTSIYPSLMPQLMLNVLLPKKSVAAALPNLWLSNLKAEGIHIAKLKSFHLMFLEQIYGIFRGIRCFVSLTTRTTSLEKSYENKYIVFNDLPENAFPNTQKDANKHAGFLNWYLQQNLLNKTQNFIWIVSQNAGEIDLGVGVNISKKPFPKLEGIQSKIEFFIRSVIIIFTVFFRLVFGSWWAPIIFDELITLAYFQSLGKSKYATKYLFNNSQFHLRPLWTYLAEASGSQIIMAYYSNNVEPYEYKDGRERPVYPGYKTQNWPEYLVWSKKQENFFREQNQRIKSKFHLVGPIPFIDKPISIPKLPRNSIAVFDITTQNAAELARLGLYADYFSVSNLTGFLESIYKAIYRNNCIMVLKHKRTINNGLIDPIYLKLIDNLSELDNVINVDPDISAERIVCKTMGSISLPFTSTALITASIGKPSIYFDPTGALKTNETSQDNIPIIDNTKSLDNWISMVQLR